MELDVSLLEDPEGNPESGYRTLRERGDLSLAIRYLGHALPRLEALAWATALAATLVARGEAWSSRTTGARLRDALARGTDRRISARSTRSG